MNKQINNRIELKLSEFGNVYGSHLKLFHIGINL